MARSSNGVLLFVALMAPLSFVSCGDGGSEPEGGVSVSIESAGGGGDNAGENSLGEVQGLDFSNSRVSLDFRKGSSNSFVLTLTATDPVAGEATLELRQSQSPGDKAALISELNASVVDPDSEDLHHRYLREWERVIADSGQFQKMRPPTVAALASLAKGSETQTFRVLSTLGSITTYQEVTAKLKTTTDNLRIYVDQRNEDHISTEQIEDLARNFEGIALPREREIFGRESDINGDNHIAVLMSCVVNQMAGSGGIVTGFFFPGDLYQRSDSNPASNGQEIFYTLLPDPEGRCGTPISSEFVINNILPGVLAHEFQHMTSFNQHIFVNNSSTEEPWLNEALSHFAEDVTGFGNENPSRVKLYLSRPSRTPIVPGSSPTLSERGGGYLFLRYLYEQSGNGDAFIKRLFAKKTGIDNLETAFGGLRFADLLSRWGTALALSETGTTPDPRYNYRSRTVHPLTKNFTGICIRCAAQDGRGTVLGGPVMTSLSHYPASSTIKSTALQFFKLKNPDGILEIEGGTNLSGTLIKFQKN